MFYKRGSQEETLRPRLKGAENFFLPFSPCDGAWFWFFPFLQIHVADVTTISVSDAGKQCG